MLTSQWTESFHHKGSATQNVSIVEDLLHMEICRNGSELFEDTLNDENHRLGCLMKVTIARSEANEDNFLFINKTTSYNVGNFNELCYLSIFQVYKNTV